jgi:LDH2 family malate/lactate/ureidoglycolate dehydrogenase
VTEIYDAAELRRFAEALFTAGGLAEPKAAAMAKYLLEADLMGHDTHGLNLAAPYLGELDTGGMTAEGRPQMLNDQGSTVLWDGKYLPGVWLVAEAMELAFGRMRSHGTVTVVIRRSHHIACLAAYLMQATERGYFMLLASSDPDARGVAPHGATQPIYTPDPIAAGIPTDGDPILIDISASTTTLGLAGRAAKAGEKMPGRWLIDGAGEITDDPNVLNTEPPGAILPLGAPDRGHKGFALGLLIEALTASLGGFGRSDHPGRWGAAVYMQMINPEAFGGRAAFARESGYLTQLCRQARVPEGAAPVRMPGERALAMRRQALLEGVLLHEAIMPALAPWGEKFGVAVPTPH